MKATLICLSSLLLASSRFTYQGMFNVSETTDPKCCLYKSPIYVRDELKGYRTIGILADSPGCIAAKLNGTRGEFISNSTDFRDFYALVNIANGTGTLRSYWNGANCTAALTADKSEINFSGNWSLNPNYPVNASCCMPVNTLNLKQDKSTVYIAGTWANSEPCKNLNLTGEFKSGFGISVPNAVDYDAINPMSASRLPITISKYGDQLSVLISQNITRCRTVAIKNS